MLVQRSKHWPHSHCRGNPLAKSEELVDTHTTQENNKGFTGLIRKAPGYNLSHIDAPFTRRKAYSYYFPASCFSANVFKVAMVSYHPVMSAWHLCIPYLTVIRE